MEGGKTGRELPGIVDQIITMQFVDFGDGNPVRAFVCTSPNPWGYPAKDRAGRLDQIEPPHLGKLIAKLVSPCQREPFHHSEHQRKQRSSEQFDFNKHHNSAEIRSHSNDTIATVAAHYSPRRCRR